MLKREFAVILRGGTGGRGLVKKGGGERTIHPRRKECFGALNGDQEEDGISEAEKEASPNPGKKTR